MQDRFGKSGEINQLLSMIERAPKDQQEQILKDMEKGDPAKAALLKVRLLTVDRIYALDDETLGRILEDIDDDIFAHSLRGLDIELRQRALKLVNNEKRKNAGDLLRKTDLLEPQIEAAKRTLVQKVRALEKVGKIHLGAMVKSNINRRAA